MRGESGVLIDRARRQVAHVRTLRRELETLVVSEPSDPEQFLSYLLLREQDETIDRVLELLAIVGPSERVQSLRSRLFAGDAGFSGLLAGFEGAAARPISAAAKSSTAIRSSTF